MSALRAASLVLAFLVAASPAYARASHPGSSHAGHSSGSSAHASSGSSHAGKSKATPGVPRNTHGRIARSTEQKDAFKKTHPCPATGKSTGSCPGYLIDHVVPLKRGGADRPENMQWQTKEAAKAKDKWE